MDNKANENKKENTYDLDDETITLIKIAFGSLATLRNKEETETDLDDETYLTEE